MRLVARRLFVFALLLSLMASAQQTSAPAPASTSAATVIPENLSLFEAEQLLVQRNLAVSAGRSQERASEAARRMASYKPNPQLQLGMEQIPFQSSVPNSVPRFFATNSD